MLSNLKARIRRSIDYQVERHIVAGLRDIRQEQQRIALRETAEFVSRNLNGVRVFQSRDELLVAMIQLANNCPGLVLEFGVYRGTSVNLIASSIAGVVHGFDSFDGLPENWRDGHEAGTFKLEALPAVRENVVLHKGWFSDTLPTFLNEHAGTASLVHVDCDLYSSTEFVLESLAGRIAVGTVLVFDEYFNYSGWQEGEHKAFTEFVAKYGLKFEYAAYNSQSEQLAVRIV